MRACPCRTWPGRRGLQTVTGEGDHSSWRNDRGFPEPVRAGSPPRLPRHAASRLDIRIQLKAWLRTRSPGRGAALPAEIWFSCGFSFRRCLRRVDFSMFLDCSPETRVLGSQGVYPPPAASRSETNVHGPLLRARAGDTPAMDKVPVLMEYRRGKQGNRGQDYRRCGKTGWQGVGALPWTLWLYLYPRGAVTSYCKLGVCKAAGMCPLAVLEASSSKSRCRQVRAPSRGSGGLTFLPSSSNF